jgi:phosphoribosyl 1,2-cyclic phosphodiesterase
MKIRVWGARGSIPSPLVYTEYQSKIKRILELYNLSGSPKNISSFLDKLPFHLKNIYGGNTACVEVSTPNTFIILDAGTGIRILGKDIIREDRLKNYDYKMHLLFTHTHWDHIQGLPFFAPLYIKDYAIMFYSPLRDIRDRLRAQHEARFFPADFEHTLSRKYFKKIPRKGTFYINELKITVLPLKHPGGSFGYRIEENGKIFVLATDVEITSEEYESYEYYEDFFKKADILFIDAQYTLIEAMRKFDWGHTSYTMAVNIGAKAGAHKLFLFHFDPFYEDNFLSNIVSDATSHLRAMEIEGMEVFMAYEGLSLEL